MKRRATEHFETRRADLARSLAERNKITRSEAQDEVDRVMHGIVKRLRQGRPAEMPGIGKITVKTPQNTGRITVKTPRVTVRTPADRLKP